MLASELLSGFTDGRPTLLLDDVITGGGQREEPATGDVLAGERRELLMVGDGMGK